MTDDIENVDADMFDNADDNMDGNDGDKMLQMMLLLMILWMQCNKSCIHSRKLEDSLQNAVQKTEASLQWKNSESLLSISLLEVCGGSFIFPTMTKLLSD